MSGKLNTAWCVVLYLPGLFRGACAPHWFQLRRGKKSSTIKGMFVFTSETTCLYCVNVDANTNMSIALNVRHDLGEIFALFI